MRGSIALLGATVLCALGAAAPAQAQDATLQLLMRLKEKGILTDEEYAELAKLKEQQAQAPAVAPLPPQQVAPQQAAAERLDDKRMVTMTESGVGMQIGDVTLKVSGSVNGFYSHDNGTVAGPRSTVVGGLATVGGNSSAIRNGLLPGFIKFDITTQQGGWDVGAHFGFYPGINSVSWAGGANSGGAPQALATAGIDARQTYLTFGKANLGEFKIGRDIGLYGSDAILNDITLLAVGTAAGNVAPSNTSLGRIGVGYIYADFQPQITYTSPKFGGFQVAAGAFMPLVTVGLSEFNDTPGFQGKVTWDGKLAGLGVHAWVSGLTQSHENTLLNPRYTSNGIDFGSKLTFGPASLLGYYYTGKGMGTTGLFILATDAQGNPRKSDGYYLQGTLGFGKLTLGASYGASNLDLTDREVNPTLLKTNSSWVGQVRYGLTSWVTLIGEYTHTKSVAHGGNEAESDTLAAGAILFF